MTLTPEELERFRQDGWVAPARRLEEALLEPLREAVERLGARERLPRQEWLSGIHNPYGRAAKLVDCWKFLDVAESSGLLDLVEAAIGPDIVLWDSEIYLEAGRFAEHAAAGREGRYWPADPLAGVIAILPVWGGAMMLAEITRLAAGALDVPIPASALYVMRYQPATSHYNRDPLFPANRRGMEEQPLLNYPARPIWLARGVDRAGSDFAAGFAPAPPLWAGENVTSSMEK